MWHHNVKDNMLLHLRILRKIRNENQIMSANRFADIISTNELHIRQLSALYHPALKTHAGCVVNLALKRLGIITPPLRHFLVAQQLSLDEEAGNGHAG